MTDKQYYEVKAEVTGFRKVNERTVCCNVKAPEIAKNFIPGQFINIQVTIGSDNSPVLRRPFAISSADGDEFEFIFDIVGRGTEKLLDILKNRKELNILGPLGNGFDTVGRSKEKLLIAGGIGIAPIKSLVMYFYQNNTPVRLYWGNRNSDGFFDLDAFKNINAPVAASTDDGSYGFKGNVLELLKSDINSGKIASLSNYDVFTVGPEVMMKSVANFVENVKSRCQVSLETPMACGMGVCQGCAVKKRSGEGYYLVCKDGPVFYSDQIVF
jgi:dihydroorotate dehydrogenase electron transfer subunit